MAGNYAQLLDIINNPTDHSLPAWDNNNHLIEGLTVKQYLLTIISSLTVGYQFMGVASTNTSGGSPDQNVFYIAGAGTYNGFGSNPITIDAGYIGIILWNGAWSSEPIKIADPVSVSQNTITIGRESHEVATDKVPIAIGVNLLNPNDADVKLGYYINSVGDLTASASYNASGFISVESGETYSSAKLGGFRFVNFYTIDKVHISNSQIANVTSFTMPNNAAFIRISIAVERWGIAQVTKGAELLDYVQYSPIAQYYAKPLNKSVTDETLESNRLDTLEEKTEIIKRSDNLFDFNTMVIDGEYINNSGAINSASGWARTDYIPIEEGHSYFISAKVIGRNYGLGWFDENKQIIGDGQHYIFDTIQTAPTNAKYLVFNLASNNVYSTEVMLVEGTQAKPYQSYYVISDYSVEPNVQRELDLLEEDLVVENTINLFDKDSIVLNELVNNSGGIQFGSGWARSDYIEIEEGEKYYITAETIARATGLGWYDASKQLVSGGAEYIFDRVLTAPEGAKYLVFNVGQNNVLSTKIMMVEGETPTYYESKRNIPMDSVRGLANKFKDTKNELQAEIDEIRGGGLSLTISNTYGFIFQTSKGAITLANRAPSHLNNVMLNFSSWSISGQSRGNSDDVAPAHILNMTIGANHGLPCAKVNIPSHGFDNTIIGTEWSHSDGRKYYPALIIDADNILFISENTGTISSPIFFVMGTGTLSYNGNSYTISTVVPQQLYPSIADYSLSVKTDDKTVSDEGQYNCKKAQLIESYTIINPASVLTNLIARAGQSDEPSFDGTKVARVENIYQIDDELNVLVISNFVVLDDIAFSNVMFAQAISIAESGVKYYIPNSLPWGSVDLRTPQVVNWSSSIPYMITDSDHTKDTTKPINRVIQYSGNLGFALGFVPTLGVGADLSSFTSETFEIRNNTGKIYPHGVNSTVKGDSLSEGDMFSAVLYRCFFDASTTTNRQSEYHFELNGVEYVFIDYKGSMIDKVNLDKSSLNGKKVEVVESQNAELKTNVYNDGFYVEADYVTNETCYIVVKIS